MVRDGGVTIYEVAERAGVSISTVSRVLRGSVPVTEATRGRVLDAVAALKYVPSAAASRLAAKRQPALGLVLPHLEGEYYSELLIGFELAAAELGYTVAVTLADPRSDARAAVRAMAEGVEGIAFMARSAASDELIDDLAGPRAVVTVARSQIAGVPALFAANHEAAHQLTMHLVESGRRRVLFVGTPEPGSDLNRRHFGYREALEESGLAAHPPIETPLEEASGFAVADRLLAEARDVDGLVCGNDLLALAIMRRLTDAGVRVPDDLAITGWDDLHASRYVRPGLTTVAQPTRELARRAVLALHGQGARAGEQSPPVQVLDSQVVHRESCCSAGLDATTELTSVKENPPCAQPERPLLRP